MSAPYSQVVNCLLLHQRSKHIETQAGDVSACTRVLQGVCNNVHGLLAYVAVPSACMPVRSVSQLMDGKACAV